MDFVRTLSVLILPVAAAFSSGCSWAPFDFQRQSRGPSADASRRGVTEAPHGIDVSQASAAQNAPAAPAASAAPGASLEERIKRYVKRFPGSDTSRKLKADEPTASARLADARAGEVVTGGPPAAPVARVAQTAPPAAPASAASGGPERIRPAAAPVAAPAAPPGPPDQTLPAPSDAPPAAPSVESVSIRPNTSAIVLPPEPAAAPEDAARPPPNQPVTAAGSETPASLASVIAVLEKTLNAQPENLADQLKLRLLYLLDGQDEKALAPAEGMSNEMAALLGSLMKTVAAVQGSAADRNAATDEALGAIDAFRTLLRSHAELAIPRIALCRRVDSFGVFEEITSRSFPAGRQTPVIVYCEVKNFSTEQMGPEMFRTLLSQRLEVLTKEGESVWEIEAADIEDQSRNRREDFFLAQVVHLPASLKPGDYVLNVSIEDKLGAKSNERKLDFTITPSK